MVKSFQIVKCQKILRLFKRQTFSDLSNVKKYKLFNNTIPIHTKPSHHSCFRDNFDFDFIYQCSKCTSPNKQLHSDTMFAIFFSSMNKTLNNSLSPSVIYSVHHLHTTLWTFTMAMTDCRTIIHTSDMSKARSLNRKKLF